MQEFLDMLKTTAGSGALYTLILLVTFIGIVIYVFTGKKRAKRFEQDAEIPFLDDEDKGPKP